MGYTITNIGGKANVPAYEIYADTPADVDMLDVSKIPAGSTVFIISTGVVKMLNTQKQWIEL